MNCMPSFVNVTLVILLTRIEKHHRFRKLR